jgi:iron-sulfur cluster assembly accessory protein
MDLLTLTERASKRISDLAAQHAPKKVRLTTPKSGCAGFKYEMQLVDAIGPNDHRVAAGDAEVFVEPQSLMNVLGMTVDWKETKLGREFTFDNPNATSSCGCGESFAV